MRVCVCMCLCGMLGVIYLDDKPFKCLQCAFFGDRMRSHPRVVWECDGVRTVESTEGISFVVGQLFEDFGSSVVRVCTCALDRSKYIIWIRPARHVGLSTVMLTDSYFSDRAGFDFVFTDRVRVRSFCVQQHCPMSRTCRRNPTHTGAPTQLENTSQPKYRNVPYIKYLV